MKHNATVLRLNIKEYNSELVSSSLTGYLKRQKKGYLTALIRTIECKNLCHKPVIRSINLTHVNLTHKSETFLQRGVPRFRMTCLGKLHSKLPSAKICD